MPRKVRQDTPHKEVGKRLRAYRIAIEQDNLGRYADEAGVQPNAYSQHETGVKRISIEAALALRARHGITLDWIYAGDHGDIPRRITDKMDRLLKE